MGVINHACTDHSREHALLICASPQLVMGDSLGIRNSFADIGATVAQLFGIPWSGPGTSFSFIIGD